VKLSVLLVAALACFAGCESAPPPLDDPYSPEHHPFFRDVSKASPIGSFLPPKDIGPGEEDDHWRFTMYFYFDAGELWPAVLVLGTNEEAPALECHLLTKSGEELSPCARIVRERDYYGMVNALEIPWFRRFVFGPIRRQEIACVIVSAGDRKAQLELPDP
jgi:hypothetical protein